MNLKRPLAVLLTAALTASLCVLPGTATSFPDTVDHPAAPAIDAFTDLGILQGYEDGTFRPNGTITRAELCTVLSRVISYKTRTENIFLDVEKDAWYESAVLLLCGAGLIEGDGNGNFRPMDTITREEALLLVARAFGLIPLPGSTDAEAVADPSDTPAEDSADPSVDSPAEQPSETPVEQPTESSTEQPAALPYTDAAAISPWALEGVTALWSGGYLPEGSETLDPAGLYTRAEAVALLHALVTDLGWEAAGKIIVDGKLLTIADYYYSPADFAKDENGRVIYTGSDAVPSYGIDVSAHQKEIDWQAVAADGVDFAILRLGYRGYTVGNIFLDDYFYANLEGALAAGLKVGVYFFSQAISVEEALEEAAFVLETIEPYREVIDLPVVYDWENIGLTHARTYKMDRDVLDACALAFCGAVEEAGWQPMIYFYPNLGKEFYHLDVVDEYPFWYCDYRNIYPTMERPFRIWQYTSSGSVAGVEGNVDWNVCFWEY